MYPAYMMIVAKYKDKVVAEAPSPLIFKGKTPIESELLELGVYNIMMKIAHYLIHAIKKAKQVYIATGKTYDAKEDLKATGFKWQPETRVWWSYSKPKDEYHHVDFVPMPEKYIR
jgi:hypothetical protein